MSFYNSFPVIGNKVAKKIAHEQVERRVFLKARSFLPVKFRPLLRQKFFCLCENCLSSR